MDNKDQNSIFNIKDGKLIFSDSNIGNSKDKNYSSFIIDPSYNPKQSLSNKLNITKEKKEDLKKPRLVKLANEYKLMLSVNKIANRIVKMEDKTDSSNKTLSKISKTLTVIKNNSEETRKNSLESKKTSKTLSILKTLSADIKKNTQDSRRYFKSFLDLEKKNAGSSVSGQANRMIIGRLTKLVLFGEENGRIFRKMQRTLSRILENSEGDSLQRAEDRRERLALMAKEPRQPREKKLDKEKPKEKGIFGSLIKGLLSGLLSPILGSISRVLGISSIPLLTAAVASVAGITKLGIFLLKKGFGAGLVGLRWAGIASGKSLKVAGTLFSKGISSGLKILGKVSKLTINAIKNVSQLAIKGITNGIKLLGSLTAKLGSVAFSGIQSALKTNVGKAGLGGAAGFLAGEGVSYGYQAITGNKIGERGEGTEYLGSGARVGARVGAGFAVGGPLGAITASLVGIVQDLHEMYSIGKETLSLYKDISKLNTKSQDVIRDAQNRIDSNVSELDPETAKVVKAVQQAQLDYQKLQTSDSNDYEKIKQKNKLADLLSDPLYISYRQNLIDNNTNIEKGIKAIDLLRDATTKNIKLEQELADKTLSYQQKLMMLQNNNNVNVNTNQNNTIAPTYQYNNKLSNRFNPRE